MRKLDLIARKLDLGPGTRLLDVGCGWGSLAIHAARSYGCRVVGITLSEPQRALATDRAAQLGLAELCEFRVQDYRDVDDGPYDAISSVGMFEHVGRRSLEAYVASSAPARPRREAAQPRDRAAGDPRRGSERRSLAELLRQGAIAAGFRGPSKIHSPFMERYVFPDGELHEVGVLASMFQAQGFELRDLESLREHYALTLRCWVGNLEEHWVDAVEEVGEQRARVWRLYMAGSAVGFERHHLEIHQLLLIRPRSGESGMELRPDFEPGSIDDWTSELVEQRQPSA